MKKPNKESLRKEIAKLKLEVERLNSESIEQMGIAQDTEAELQAVSKEFEAYKRTTDRIIEKLTSCNFEVVLDRSAVSFELEESKNLLAKRESELQRSQRSASALKDALTFALEAIP